MEINNRINGLEPQVSLIHISDENSRFRKFLLYFFARHIEVPMLAAGYHLLRGKWSGVGGGKAFRFLAARLFARPMGRWGDTARPLHYEGVMELINGQEGEIAVGPCRCRSGHRACPHPLETDIVIRTGTEAWLHAFPNEYRVISKQEACRIVTDCRDQGMFQMVFIHCPVNKENEYVICNCCVCGCVPYILNRELGQENFPLIPGPCVSVTDSAKCSGAGKCAEVCPFGARKMIDGMPALKNCMGCGLCAHACPAGAISMEKRGNG